MRRSLSLRVRLALLVSLAAFVVLTIVGVVLVRIVEQRMLATVRSEAVRAVERAASSMEAGSIDDVPTGVPGEPQVQVSSGDRPDDVPGFGDLQASLAGELASIAPGEVVSVRRDIDGVPVYVALTVVAVPGGGSLTLATSTPLRETARTLSALRTSAIFVVPTVAVLLGLLAAVIAGRSLRPVAIMRAEADAISHGTLHHRLSPAARSSELADLADTMNDMLDRLDRAATSQRQFVSDVSHELRSPLSTIRGTLELAIRNSDNLRDAGPVALGEVDRLDGLVRDLLTLARLDEPGPSDVAEVDLEDVVAAGVAAVHRSELQFDTSGVHPARLLADPRALTGLVRNIVDNAARHAATTVTITLTVERDGVELTVDDDGPGIAPGDRQRVFERFARLDDGRSRDAGGSGLGLAVAAAAAHAQAGSITVMDAPSGGARFRVMLPTKAPGRPGSCCDHSGPTATT